MTALTDIAPVPPLKLDRLFVMGCLSGLVTFSVAYGPWMPRSGTTDIIRIFGSTDDFVLQMEWHSCEHLKTKLTMLEN